MVEWKCCEKRRGTKDNPTICMACPEIKIEAEEKLAEKDREILTLSQRDNAMATAIAEKDKEIAALKRIKATDEEIMENDRKKRLVDFDRLQAPKEADKRPDDETCPKCGSTQIVCWTEHT